MQISIDKNNLIVGFAEVGGFDGGIEIDNSIVPDAFIQMFKPKYFLYQDEQIITNPNYEEESNTSYIPPMITPNASDEELRKMFANMQEQLVQSNIMAMEVAERNAKLAQEVVNLSKEIEVLKGVGQNEDDISEI